MAIAPHTTSQAAPLTQGKVEVVALFATPIVIAHPGDAETLNRALRESILAREKTHPSTQHSNKGGWQSNWDLETWGGEAVARLLAFARDTATRLTADRDGKPAAPVWKLNSWANINRTGHGNEFHCHPGSFWSGTYYVDDGGIAANPALGGELEFMDPRGPAPAMYAPNLTFAVPGGASIGASQTITPRAGMMVLFPAWVLHAVRPYGGQATRISIAFNLSL